MRRSTWNAAFVATLLCVTDCSAQEWTRFRGPNGSGLGRVERLPVRWQTEDFRWRTTLHGIGHSSPVLWGDRIFVTSADEKTGTQFVESVNAKDGNVLWQREFPALTYEKHALNSFASSTPTVDKSRVYLTWGTPTEHVVLAMNHAGEPVWKRDLGPVKSLHGLAASPILKDGLLIVVNDQDAESGITALDATTGETRWTVARMTTATYSTPCLLERSEKRDGGEESQQSLDDQADRFELIVTNRQRGISSFDVRSGALLWEKDVFGSHVAVSSPIVAPGSLVIGVCGGVGVKEEVVVVKPPTGSSEAAEHYRLDQATPFVPSPLAVDGRLYLWSDEGIVTCADLQDGRVYWRKRLGGKFYASPVFAAGHIYNTSTEGEVIVLAASSTFREVARNPLGGPSHSTPAIAGNAMFLRTTSTLVMLDFR